MWIVPRVSINITLMATLPDNSTLVIKPRKELSALQLNNIKNFFEVIARPRLWSSESKCSSQFADRFFTLKWSFKIETPKAGDMPMLFTISCNVILQLAHRISWISSTVSGVAAEKSALRMTRNSLFTTPAKMAKMFGFKPPIINKLTGEMD